MTAALSSQSAVERPGLAPAALRAALAAGNAIMEVYAGDFAVDYKDDQSPLTHADRAAHRCIVDGLQATGLPVLSEEGAPTAYGIRRDWPAFWLVDPLDGTKEFVQRNGDFTVNIALIERGRPVLGVVYAPAHQDLYIGARGWGAVRATGPEISQWPENFAAGLPVAGQGIPPFTALVPGGDDPDGPLRVVASRSHGTPATDAFLARLRTFGRGVELVSRGSALKLCMVASGEAHLYPRLAPTMEWDTAAAQAVVEGAGGRVVVYDDAAQAAFMEIGPEALFAAPSLAYNRGNLRNPWFVALHPSIARHTEMPAP